MKNDNNKKTAQVSVNPDTTPVLYTDNIIVSANGDGVVLDVTQRIASTNKVRIVARIGMSREYAKKFVNKLGGLLIKSEGKIDTGKGLVN